MTKFIDKNQEGKAAGKPTKFNRVVEACGSFNMSVRQPTDFAYVEHLFTSLHYGDVFAAWHEGGEGMKMLFYGEKGDELYER